MSFGFQVRHSFTIPNCPRRIAKSGGYGLDVREPQSNDLAIQAERFSTGLLLARRFSNSLQNFLRLMDIPPGMRYQDNLCLAGCATLHFQNDLAPV
jgi:hypothetical protein